MRSLSPSLPTGYLNERPISLPPPGKFALINKIDGLVKSCPAVSSASGAGDLVFARSVIAPAKGQLDGWFLLRSVSLVGAPSGAGKTSILYHLLVDQRKGEPFLGHKTFGLPFYVIGADRGKDAHLRTMERMGLPADSVPFAKMPANVFGVEAVQMIVRKLEKLQERGESPAMLLVEGVDFMVEENNDIIVVSQFMTSLTRVAEHFNIAIIATMGSPKLKAGQGYEMKRHLSWSAVT